MSALNIPIHAGNIGNQTVQTVNARELHQFLEVEARFNDWIARQIEAYEFTEGEDFYSELSKTPSGGRPRKDYHISIDMAKELSMVERTKKGKQARQYFIEWERKGKSNVFAFDPENPAQLRGLLVNYAERTQIAEARAIELEPKAEAFERLEASEGSVTPRVAAKMLDVPERKFVKWLEVNSWAFRQGKVLQGYAERRKQGYLEHEPRTFIDGNGDERTSMQLKITPKGLARLAKIMGKGEAA